MALSNALFAALSGLDVSQTKLQVVSNNIANVNTVAFKSTRVLIKPQFYVTDSGGSQPEGDFGGTNPSQRGLGAVTASIEKDFGTGTIENTGRNTDLAIDGDGFFIVRSDTQKYTRDGSFRLNSAQQLVTSSGDLVQGYAVDSNYNIIPGQLTDIQIPLNATTAEATRTVEITGNLDASGVPAAGASILTSQLLTTVGGAAAPSGAMLLTAVASTAAPAAALFAVNDEFTLQGQKGGRLLPADTFTVTAGSTLNDLITFFTERLGINTAVPDDGNPATPTAGIAVEIDGADPNSGRLVITGNMGADNALELLGGSFTTPAGYSPLAFADGTNNAGIASNPSGESVFTSAIAYDSLGNLANLDIRAVMEAPSSWRFFVESASNTDGDRVVGTGTLTFDNYGNLLSSDGTGISIERAGTGAITPLNINLDFSKLKSLAEESALHMVRYDGAPAGRLDDYFIGEDGKITGNFSNGVKRLLGQIGIATFANRLGLVDRGGNMFIEGVNSGPAVIGTAGTLGSGKIVGGALEMSNVDLSEEFINLIIASTGFSASSRVISTSDQLLTELLNTTR